MELINRAAITVSYLKPYIDWHNKLVPDLPMEENSLKESATYLIKEDFDDINKVLQKQFIHIFENELYQTSSDESDWPKTRDLNVFFEWFSVEVSRYVFDLSNRKLRRSDYDL